MTEQKSVNAEGPATVADGIFGVGVPPEEAALVYIPVPVDATTSYQRGASDGPEAILAASVQLDLTDPLRDDAYEDGLCMLPIPPDLRQKNEAARALVDAARRGEDRAAEVNRFGDEVNVWVREQTARFRDLHKVTAVVGGDHSVPFAHIEEIARRHPKLGVLHIDAHADLREAYEGFTWSHASIMRNVIERVPISALVQVGIRDVSATEKAFAHQHPAIHTFYDYALRESLYAGTPFARIVEEILAPLPEEVYISFDIDGLDPALCPHTGTPVPGGLTFNDASFLLRQVVRSGRKVVGFDLNEVAPGPDDELDGNVGARLLYLMTVLALA